MKEQQYFSRAQMLCRLHAEAARTCWSSVLPQLKFKVVEEEHTDVWGARNALQVVECMGEHLGLELR